jgi:hypothetical protein
MPNRQSAIPESILESRLALLATAENKPTIEQANNSAANRQ